jgi:histone acetyltransferase MYST1
LEDIAKSTNLRIDDAAFALNECALLMRRLSLSTEDEERVDVVVITRRLVEQVAKERNVKRMYLDSSSVIL